MFWLHSVSHLIDFFYYNRNPHCNFFLCHLIVCSCILELFSGRKKILWNYAMHFSGYGSLFCTNGLLLVGNLIVFIPSVLLYYFDGWISSDQFLFCRKRNCMKLTFLWDSQPLWAPEYMGWHVGLMYCSMEGKHCPILIRSNLFFIFI